MHKSTAWFTAFTASQRKRSKLWREKGSTIKPLYIMNMIEREI
jgi:hypothetical protein